VLLLLSHYLLSQAKTGAAAVAITSASAASERCLLRPYDADMLVRQVQVGSVCDSEHGARQLISLSRYEGPVALPI
jgi:hypothetical protein